MALRIEDYALIGDCESAALIGRDGSIDWLCWPRFDSPACLAALLGNPRNGRWLVAPKKDGARVSRRYRGDTLILESDFVTPDGGVRVVDFMPVRGEAPDLVRMVTGLSGGVDMRMVLSLRFDYGQIAPWIVHKEDGRVIAVAGPDLVVFNADVPVDCQDGDITAEFTVQEGQTVSFVLTHGPSHQPPPVQYPAEEELADCERFWSGWSAKCNYRGPWRDILLRSHITLKALTFQPTGGVVAAPTASLPEALGGPRNWDYRYCWLRDATFTLISLMDAGYWSEARAWRDWLIRAVAGSPDKMQIMYGLGGERRLMEWQADWLSGYENSAPVRFGNAAHGQLQLDVYGEVIDALHQARKGLGTDPMIWSIQRTLLDRLEEVWSQPDEGIWEVRSGRRHFVHSKVMAWVAFDRAVKAVEDGVGDGPADKWRRIRAAIHDQVCEKGFDRDLGSFVQAYGSRTLDASSLLIPQVGFLPPADARIVGTVSALRKQLTYHGLLRRYDPSETPDGLPSGEGVFLACNFWLVDALILIGDYAEGRSLFERLIALRNDVGLLAEEYDPAGGRMLGNFPQAFSHVALANTIANLAGHAPPGEKRQAKD